MLARTCYWLLLFAVSFLYSQELMARCCLPASPPANTSSIEKIIVVDIHGKGNFRSIQAALNSLSDTSVSPRVILIKHGVYREKIFIEKHNIILKGEDKNNTILTQSIARDQWRCSHRDDWGVATININGNDITLQNLSIVNNYGFEWKESVSIACPLDTASHEKLLRKDGHQMALRTMMATRLKVLNCNLKAFGGDTVSPWNVDKGLFYFKDCLMEGGVDFYCPRGWAYAENCRFVAHSGMASIWHDGSSHESSKTVLKNCSFEGFDGFKLGRYHRDAQFFLVNCKFPRNMSDTDIYLVPTTNVIRWGRRIYYFNCHRKGGDYSWHRDNLPSNLDGKKINAAWTFEGKWHPN